MARAKDCVHLEACEKKHGDCGGKCFLFITAPKTCNTCKHADEGVCYNVEGENNGHASEIAGSFTCGNFERR